MVGIYDIHTHLNDSIYIENDVTSSELIKNAKKIGVDIINIVGYDVKSSKIAIRQATQDANVYAVVGIHPNEAHYFNDEAVEAIEEMANSPQVVAIGEIGLDYSRTDKYRGEQIHLLKKQLKVAKNLDLPVMLHIKDKKGHDEAYQDVYDILKKAAPDRVVIHGYEGNYEWAQKFLKLNYCLSFDGQITYGITELEKIVKDISLNQILIETDAPFHAPKPYQKEVNYPEYARLIAEKVSQLMKIDIDEIISSTRTNGQKLFKIK